MADKEMPPSIPASIPASVPESDPHFLELLHAVAKTTHAPVPNGSMIGEYRVVKQLGRGSHGTVYEVMHVIIERAAALKVLNPEFSRDPLIVQRFVDEARAVNRIKHANIVDIFGFGELADGRKYCVMHLLKGCTLAERLEAERRLPREAVLHILNEIASALDAAHKASVVHRDLKPQNIFLSHTNDGRQRVTLLDFGIARMAGDKRRLRTGDGVLLGTPAYMSPEQCASIEVDHRTDIYSLGVVAFELLTGRRPFAASGSQLLVVQHLTEPPPRPTELAPDLPAQVDRTFARWLAKKPDERPASASAAVEALAVALRGRTSGSIARRRLWISAALLVLAVTLVLLSLWSKL